MARKGYVYAGSTESFDVVVELGDALEDQGNLEEALQKYRFALQMAIYGRSAAHDRRATSLVAEGRLEEARDELMASVGVLEELEEYMNRQAVRTEPDPELDIDFDALFSSVEAGDTDTDGDEVLSATDAVDVLSIIKQPSTIPPTEPILPTDDPETAHMKIGRASCRERV